MLLSVSFISTIGTKLELTKEEFYKYVLEVDREYLERKNSIEFRTNYPEELIKRCTEVNFPFKYELRYVNQEKMEDGEMDYAFDQVFTLTKIKAVHYNTGFD